MYPASVVKTLKRLFDSNDFPFLLPLPPWADATDREVRRIRHAARAALRQRDLAARGWFALVCAATAWPLIALIKAGRETRTSFRLHPGRAASIVDAWWLQLAHNLRLADLHYSRIDLPEQRRRVRRLVTDTENKYLLETINRGAASAALGDKHVFAEFCRIHGLPTPQVLARGLGHGRGVAKLAPWPASDLFLKPANAWGGEGARLLRHDSARGVWSCETRDSITAENIGMIAQELVGDPPWLLQPRLTNGPELADLAGPDSALATVRVVTGRMLPNGPVEIVAGFMRFPLKGKIVDNLCAGGLGADYDPATGILGPARTLGSRNHPFTHHPETGGPIAHRRIPRWDEIADLARRAHRPVPDIATLGWDIALTADGPLLIETNPNWGIPLDTPLGDTSYARFLLQPALRSRLP